MAIATQICEHAPATTKRDHADAALCYEVGAAEQPTSAAASRTTEMLTTTVEVAWAGHWHAMPGPLAGPLTRQAALRISRPC